MKKEGKVKDPGKKDEKKKEEKKKEVKQEEIPKQEEAPKIIETKGNGRFEYSNGTVYIGDFLDRNGHKTKQGYGKLMFEGITLIRHQAY